METLRGKHTWDLVKSPPGVNIMDLMWVYNIKWDGQGNQIKDKVRVVGKGYTQQLGVDYNETWAGVTCLESVQMTWPSQQNSTLNSGASTSLEHT